MAIMVSVVLTALVSAIFWVAGESAQRTGSLGKSDEAAFAAEAGLNRVLWYAKNNKMGTIPSPLTGTVNGYAYSTSWTASGNTYAITSTGSLGNVSYTLSQSATTSSAASTIAAGTTLSSTSLLTVTGTMYVSGNITSSGTFTVNGNVDAGGTIPAGVVATGTKTPNDPSVPSAPSASTIYNTLLPSASAITAGNVTTLDFTGHPVLVANGNVTLKLTSVTGTGTLIVNGAISTGTDVGAAGAPLTFNLVSTGNFMATNKFYLIGSIYSGGTLGFNNQTDVTGTISAAGAITLNNHHAFTFATPPSFDPRSGHLTLGTFTGPMP